MKWSSPADLKMQVQKWWDKGQLLCEKVTGESSFPRKLTFKVPTSSEMSENFDELRSWISSMKTMSHFRVEMREFNHRVLGRNSIPTEIWIDSLENAVECIGKKRDFSRFTGLLKMTSEREPKLLSWLAKKPFMALQHCDNWPKILDIVSWMRSRPRPNIYMRQVDIVGIDSKFIESNRAVLAEIFDEVLPVEQIDTSFAGASQFNRRFGFKEKPLRVRFRILDPGCAVLRGDLLQDISIDVESFAKLDPPVSVVFFTENEINFLAFPAVAKSMVVFGSGYGFDYLANAQWLRELPLYFWGDIDTHGFAILSSLRAILPHTKSLLMDEQTLIRHMEFAGEEKVQHSSEHCWGLTENELAVYKGLKEHRWKSNLRLEQERISWDYACDAIRQAHSCFV
ncbi:MAG: hypothetical protein K2X81_12025 [Candidatus Obscuribacterales bacterium]|nr:hypothetical protein [Candidatus Obscuribacterales bacterium]